MTSCWNGKRSSGVHDDAAEPDMPPSEKLETALAESKKRRQQRPRPPV
ncbi:hypothetical protein STRAU_6318 [Streptomyces aurantiacus JA 4570]|uniref:Uncharacterized protein n=1 Tax=Streptomyces aurantiacus JA 4570 TaxID=1286094 RepID=S3ZAA4_9ACTN|nr:hypothetical protein STRAU_6318 [Streptomyces aurantiacus JA 4570]